MAMVVVVRLRARRGGRYTRNKAEQRERARAKGGEEARSSFLSLFQTSSNREEAHKIVVDSE
jgi:hypothetical protein